MAGPQNGFQLCWPIVNDVTHILCAIEQGDPRAAGQLLPLVYDHLRQLAAQRLAHEKPGQTLDATALVHEAYLRLVAIPIWPVDPLPVAAHRKPRELTGDERGRYQIE